MRNLDFRNLVQAAGDAIVCSNRDGAIILWNAAAERIFGHSEADALGQSLDLIIPERQRARHWQGYHLYRLGLSGHGFATQAACRMAYA